MAAHEGDKNFPEPRTNYEAPKRRRPPGLPEAAFAVVTWTLTLTAYEAPSGLPSFRES